MFVKMNRSGNFRGSKYSKDEIIEVGEDLGNRIISNGQGSKSSEAEFKKAIEDAKEKDKKDAIKYYKKTIAIDGNSDAQKKLKKLSK